MQRFRQILFVAMREGKNEILILTKDHNIQSHTDKGIQLVCLKIVTAGTSHVRIQERDDKKNKMQKVMQEAM